MEVEVSYYDSVSGLPLFKAPVARSYSAFLSESKAHGWPSFRDEEVVWENVRVLADGETVSISGTHLGLSLPLSLPRRPEYVRDVSSPYISISARDLVFLRLRHISVPLNARESPPPLFFDCGGMFGLAPNSTLATLAQVTTCPTRRATDTVSTSSPSPAARSSRRFK